MLGAAWSEWLPVLGRGSPRAALKPPSSSVPPRRCEIPTMRLLRIPVTEAEGEILAHSLKIDGRKVRKGQRLGQEDCLVLGRSDTGFVTVARLENCDLDENEAAEKAARAACGNGVLTGRISRGRCEVVAQWDGLAVLNEWLIETANLESELLGISTIAGDSRVSTGQAIASCKVVPPAIALGTVNRVCRILSEFGGVVSVAPFQPVSVALLQTTLPGIGQRLIAKTTETVGERVRSLGGTLAWNGSAAHDVESVVDRLRHLADYNVRLIVIIGASATCGRDDVLPSAIHRVGGQVHRLGLPVEPGSLSLVATIGQVHVLGLPESFRSPCRQGGDWLIERIFAGRPIRNRIIARLGSGGLARMD